ALLIELGQIVLDLLLLARHRFGLAERVLDVAARASRLLVLQLALGLLQLLHGLRRRGRRVRIAVGRGLTHRVRRLLQLTRGLLQLGPVLFTRELLELTRGFFGLIRKLPLRIAAAGSLLRLGAAALTFGFLLLPARQLLQFLRELVELLVRLLL